MRFLLSLLCPLVLLSGNPDRTAQGAERKLPNIVFVLFDDLGYGQFRGLVEDSEFPMPHLEQLAKEGMTFTDLHAAAAVCTPTRYGLLTGRYPSRIGQFGVLTTFSPPIIPEERLTVGGMLQQAGYTTACIGKWHLGLVWEDGKPGTQKKVPLGAELSFGPQQNGFDYFYGFAHARNIGTIIEQNEVVAHVEAVDNQPLMTRQAVQFIEQQAQMEDPFFLYFPMCPPHKPIAPTDDYTGKSGAVDEVGHDPLYGDWIYQGDAMLGALLQTLEQTGQSDHTIVFAASDNGAEHRAYLPLRDSKRSIYEGGHRVPLVVRWPEHIREASTSHTPVCLNDVFATLAEIVDFDLPENAAEDSVSLLDLLLERQTLAARSSPVVHQSSKGDLAIRSRNWKLIFHRSGERELFDIDTDVGELVNVLKLYPETAEELTQQMQSLIDRGRSTPGPSQPNEHPLKLKSAGSN